MYVKISDRNEQQIYSAEARTFHRCVYYNLINFPLKKNTFKDLIQV